MMDLLPKSHQEFSSVDYWENFFKKRGGKAFEWYGQYHELCGVLHKYIKPTDHTLVIGCGNSRLSADLYDVGYHNITNIDISEIVIKQMTEQNAAKRPDMKFIKMDLKQLEFGDGVYGVVLDKGTLDALMPDNSSQTHSTINQIFAEVGRVLKIGGRYICITLAQDHILNKVLEYFPKEGWMVRVHKILQDLDDNREFQLPVFAFVFTKFKAMPNFKPIFEVCHYEDQLDRVETASHVKEAIKQMQQYAVVRHRLQKRQISDEQLSLDLYSPASAQPRYTLYVVDAPRQTRNRFAAFIVPEGRETEWLFSTSEGRRQLSETAGFSRLVVVCLNRDHTYAGLDAVKDELSTKILELAPSDLGHTQVPFLSTGDDINKRHVRHRGNSKMSGDYVVEDVEADEGDINRRLVFLSNQNIVQSEGRLKKESAKKKGSKKKIKMAVDPGYLACQHHYAMAAGLSLLPNATQLLGSVVDVLLVGLGGGALPYFIYNFLAQVRMDIVEIDAAMLTVAQEWFNFPSDPRLDVHIEDGLTYIQTLALQGVRRHVVMLDADSKDQKQGMSCPPAAFIQPSVLKNIHTILHQTGVFMLNFVCREQALRSEVMNNLKSIFPHILTVKIPEHINEVVFAFPHDKPKEITWESHKQLPKQIASNLDVLQGLLKSRTKGYDIPLLTDKLEGLQLVT